VLSIFGAMQGPAIDFFSTGTTNNKGCLVCFSCPSHQDLVAATLGWFPIADAIRSNCNVTKYMMPSTNVIVFCAFMRVPGATRGFLHKLYAISDGFEGNVLVADKRMTEDAFRAAGLPFKLNYFTVSSATELEVLLNVDMTDAQRDVIHSSVFVAPRRNVPLLPPQQYLQNRMVNRFFATMGRRGAPAPPPPDMMRGSGIVFHLDHDAARLARPFGNHTDMYALGQRLSAEAFERERGSRIRVQRDPDPLPEGWESILSEAEDCVSGYPECLICRAKKATVFFPECNHMTACDNCVWRMWTDSTIPSECPLCPGVRKGKIMRPITSEVTEKDDDDDGAMKKRKKRK